MQPRGADKFVHCPYCNGAHPLKYKRTLFGKIRVTRKCCKSLVGIYEFPKYMGWKERRMTLKWLNS